MNTSSLDVACYITVIPKDVTQFSLYHLGQGRFGNILFEYASVMGIANHSNRKALFGPRMTRLQHVFPNLKMNILTKQPQSWKVVVDNITYDFQRTFFNLPKRNMVIRGHFCSFRYFTEISSRLYREIFSHINQAFLLVAQNFTYQAKKTTVGDTKELFQKQFVCM